MITSRFASGFQSCDVKILSNREVIMRLKRFYILARWLASPDNEERLVVM
jgi:hypothetical protein